MEYQPPALSAGDPTWGLTTGIDEPPANQVIAGPGFTVAAGVVGALGMSNRMEQPYPSARDWSVSLAVVRTRNGGGGLVQPAPSIGAKVTYGTGAVRNTFLCDVPSVGLALHLTAQWLEVATTVRGNPFPGRLDVSVSGSPGTPADTVFTQVVNYPTPVGDPFALVRVPTFAVGVSVMTQETPTAAGAQVGNGQWLYRSEVNGTSGVGVSDSLPLSLSPIITTANASNAGVFIPPQANTLRLNPKGAQGYHLLQWRLQV